VKNQSNNTQGLRTSQTAYNKINPIINFYGLTQLIMNQLQQCRNSSNNPEEQLQEQLHRTLHKQITISGINSMQTFPLNA
jgi:DNA-binding transcriptional regulator WhiA